MKIINDDGTVIADGKAICLEPEDVLVFRTPLRLSQEAMANVRNQLARVMPGRKVIFLEQDATLDVLRPKAEVSA